MAGSWRPSKAFLLRKRKRMSSRRSALLSKRPAQCGLVDKTIPTEVEDRDAMTVETWAPLVHVRLLLLAVGNACQVWKNRLCQVYTGFVNSIFFWRSYAQQIKTLQNQMSELQKDLEALRSTIQGSGAAKTGCLFHGTMAAGSANLMFPQPIPLSLMLGGGCGVEALPTLTLPATLPPPPPPPPPPPLPPPAPPTTVLRPLILKQRDSNSLQSTKEKQGRLGAVTLTDLQAVKLRKVITSDCGKTKKSLRVPLVTVAALQRVCLRRSSHCDPPPKLCLSSRSPLTKSSMNLRSQLKRVKVNRSPGGTPLFDKENMETGTGLTPLMIQALRRKFQSALPKGPSPAKNISESSDDQSFC